MERTVGIVNELASSWPTKEVANGGVEVHVNNLPSSADDSTVIKSLLFCERHWRNQKKKAVWLKLLSTNYNKLLHPAHVVGFSIHRTEPTYAMLILRLEGDETSTLPANASNQVGAGPCVGSDANLQQVIDPDWCRSTLGQSQGRSGHQSNPVAILPPNATFSFPPSGPVPLSPPKWQVEQRRQLHGHGHLVVAETGCVELDPGIHPVSGLAADLVPADMGTEDSHTEAVGSAVDPLNLQTNDPGVEVLNVSEPANLETTKRTHTRMKRKRGRNFTLSQKRFLVEKKLHYQRNAKTCKRLGNWFHFVSQSYLDEHHINIKPHRWQRLMDTLVKNFKAIRAYEIKVQSGTSACVSFWKLSKDGRSSACRNGNKNLPLIFDHEMYQLVETINQIPEANPQETRERQAGALGESSSRAMTATISDPADPSAGNRPSSFPIEVQVSTESPSPSDDISPETQGSQQLECEKLDLPVNPLRYRSTLSAFDEDALLERIAPFLKKQVEDTIQPVLIAEQKRAEDEKKRREQELATQADELAVMRQEQELQLQNFSDEAVPIEQALEEWEEWIKTSEDFRGMNRLG